MADPIDLPARVETAGGIAVGVECYAGYRGEETPRRVRLAASDIEIASVIDRWLAPDHRYFKVLGVDGDLYILRNDVVSGRWELTFFSRRHGGSDNDRLEALGIYSASE